MLQTSALRREYGSTVAVKDIDIEIETGEFASIVGPSGCGKTTLLRMLAGHLEPTSGGISLNDRNITDTRPQDRPTSLVFQTWALFPHMTVRENIEFPIESAGRDLNKSVEELLEMVRLDPEEHADKNASELSGGQKQRVALARSIAYDPDILLLDEPLASLDYALQKQLQRELADLNKELDMTFIYVTHSLEAALVMSDTLFVLDEGEVAQTGAPEEIYQSPKSTFIADFMGDANVFSVDAERIGDDMFRIASSEFEGTLTVNDRHDGREPTNLVVRYDDCVVRPTLEAPAGVEVRVDNILVRGNTVMIECSTDMADGYVAEVAFDWFQERTLEIGDTAYFQWEAEKSITVPE